MSEIEKMYENAGIKQARMCEWLCKDSIFCSPDCQHYGSTKLHYPSFTAEKQLELIKLLAKDDNIYITYYPPYNTYNIRYCVTGFYDGSVMGNREVTNVDFEEALAGIVNDIWQDLTEEEKQQVKGILE